MTQNFTDLIKLFSCGALGGGLPEFEHEIDAQAMYDLGKSQSIWTVIYPVIKKLEAAGKVKIAPEKQSFYDGVFFGIVTRDVQRSAVVYNAIKALEKKDICCCLLKGETLAMLYADPSTRVSTDTDFWIDTSKTTEKAVCRAMNEEGFTTRFRPETTNHAMCVHPVGGLVEFHLRLYDELFEDVWFDNRAVTTEKWRKMKTVDGHEYFTLGVTDGAIFVAMHLIKHFLSKGAGLRQLMDMLLYLKKYKAEIDFARFCELMQGLKFGKFIDLCCYAGIKYFGFSPADFEFATQKSFDDNTVLQFMDDIETGGMFGGSDESRSGFYEVYTKLRFSRFKSEDYDAYMKSWNSPKWYVRLFPPLTAIDKQYKYLKKYPFLLPVAWVQHFVDHYTRRYTADDKTQLAVQQTADRRVKLIDELDMI